MGGPQRNHVQWNEDSLRCNAKHETSLAHATFTSSDYHGENWVEYFLPVYERVEMQSETKWRVLHKPWLSYPPSPQRLSPPLPTTIVTSSPPPNTHTHKDCHLPPSHIDCHWFCCFSDRRFTLVLEKHTDSSYNFFLFLLHSVACVNEFLKTRRTKQDCLHLQLINSSIRWRWRVLVIVRH